MPRLRSQTRITGVLPRELLQRSLEFLPVREVYCEAQLISSEFLSASRRALTRGRWRPIRFVSEHGLSALQNLRGGLNSLDDGVELRWQTWTASTIYLAPHPDEENAVAVVTLRKNFRGVEGRSGRAYALVKPKAGGSSLDFEFANYPAFLIVARD